MELGPLYGLNGVVMLITAGAGGVVSVAPLTVRLIVTPANAPGVESVKSGVGATFCFADSEIIVAEPAKELAQAKS